MSSRNKVIAILQPGYLPWLGFFEQMLLADHFVYMDDVQYTRKDWRSRNNIKHNGCKVMLSVPVQKKPLGTALREICVSTDQDWGERHLNLISSAYGDAPYFDEIYQSLKSEISTPPVHLWQLDVNLVNIIREFLDITTPISFSSDIPRKSNEKNARIVEICQAHDADILYDGKAAQGFIDEKFFLKNGIKVIFQNYKHPEYHQSAGEFISHLSVIDLIFNEGPKAKDVILSSPRVSAIEEAIRYGQ